MTSPRIFLFHATLVAMEPIQAAMRSLWPEAQAVNILDESLSLDRARAQGALAGDIIRRFVALGHQAVDGGADGILITCSAFGPAIRTLAENVSIPVLMPNEAMFRAAISQGSKIGMVATFAPAIDTMEDEFREFASETGNLATLETFLAEGAIESLHRGNDIDHNRRVAEVAGRMIGFDALMLAHFSTSRAAHAVRAVVDIPVLTAPESAVKRMRSLIEGPTPCL